MKVKVKFANECPPCPDCGEPYCTTCDLHYAICHCPGPHSEREDGWDIVEEDGILWAYSIPKGEMK